MQRVEVRGAFRCNELRFEALLDATS
eukprot:SAG11_NODE_47155_length_131_cov_52.437500_1_plen_25_part_01